MKTLSIKEKPLQDLQGFFLYLIMKRTLLILSLLIIGLFAKAQDLSKADSLFNASDYNAAYYKYQSIEEVGRADTKILRRMGYCLYVSENMKSAAEGYFLKALKKDPKDLASNYLLAKCLIEDKSRLKNELDKKERLELAYKCLSYTAQSNYEDSKLLLEQLKRN